MSPPDSFPALTYTHTLTLIH